MSAMKQVITRAMLLLVGLGVAGVVYGTPVQAINLFERCESGDASATEVCKADGTDTVAGIVGNVTSVLLYAIGAVAVVMIVIGGIKYATSNGNAENIKSAKNTIMYAVIGLVAAICAQVMVMFVVNAFK